MDINNDANTVIMALNASPHLDLTISILPENKYFFLKQTKLLQQKFTWITNKIIINDKRFNVNSSSDLWLKHEVALVIWIALWHSMPKTWKTQFNLNNFQQQSERLRYMHVSYNKIFIISRMSMVTRMFWFRLTKMTYSCLWHLYIYIKFMCNISDLPESLSSRGLILENFHQTHMSIKNANFYISCWFSANGARWQINTADKKQNCSPPI